jgi:uncharacterized membrane protein YphA (DoxX/SURF4 family)
MKYMQNTSWGILVIRIGLAGVLLWFGTQQILTPADWIGYVPVWTSTFVNAHTLVLFNGSAEIIGGLLLLLGIFTRSTALVMGMHTVLIALSLGYTSVAIRDWGLTLSLFGLAFLGAGSFTIRWILMQFRRAPQLPPPQA